VANRTLDVIREFTTPSNTNSGDQPFFIINAWTAPHGPFESAPQYADLFLDISAPRTPNWNASSVYQQQKHWLLRQQSPIDEVFEQLIDTTQQQRAQTLQSVDNHISLIVNLLEEQGVLDNTIIIYTSDNGFQLGQHRLVTEKLHLYESDIRVPFVVRGPGIPKNIEVSDLTGHVDIAPTIYQLIYGQNTPIPDTMDGIPFLPIAPDAPGKQPKRTDYLINYHGSGTPPCNLLNLPPFVVNCPAPPPDDFHALDTFNNTYNCLRTIVYGQPIDFTYCRFEDDENFAEYYDNTADPWQLHNKAFNLSDAHLANLDQRLNFLKTCAGPNCRLGPYPYNVNNDSPQRK
jgi:arylsulfatase A-like enzyme